jgi:divalent metal cation (Fe/Co/Zn/Cd) transporter
MVVVAALVGVEAIQRLLKGASFEPPAYAIALIAGTLVVDLWRSRVLRRAARRYGSPALEADAANFSADVLGSVAVLAGLVAARLGVPQGDPAAALAVVVLVWAMAARIAKSAVDVLMDRQVPDLQPRLTDAARGVEGVVEVPEMKIRRSGPHAHAEVTVTVGRTHSVERSHEIAEAVSRALEQAVPGTSAVVHVEPSAEGEDVVARTFAAANRVGLADQIHNVLAIRHPEGLWLMLHAKVPPQTRLRRAHEISDALERELRSEIDGLARVEVHLEPREPQSLRGRVVSAHREALIHIVRTIAESHPPIVRCHEVAVSETADGVHLVLHCEAPPGRTIAEIHDASLQVEDEIHRTHPGVRTITVHFEPTAG